MTDNDNNNDPFSIDKAVVPTLILTKVDLEEVTSTLNKIIATGVNDIKAIEERGNLPIQPIRLTGLVYEVDAIKKFFIQLTESIQSDVDELRDKMGSTEFGKIKIRFVLSMKEKE